MTGVVLTVIIPAYNAEKYLPQCLDSVIGQTLKDIEVICVDDGSTDGSASVLQAYAQKDSRISVLTQGNSGQSAARNRALEKAKGAYVQFLDADDWLDPDCCRVLSGQAAAGKLDMLSMAAVSYEEESGRYVREPFYNFYYLTGGGETALLSRDECLQHWWEMAPSAALTIYRTDFLRANNLRFEEGLKFEDCLFFKQALFAADRVGVNRQAFYFRRKHAESTINNGGRHYLDWFDVNAKIYALAEAQGIDRRQKDRWLFSTVNYSLRLYRGIRKEYKKEFFYKAMRFFAEFSPAGGWTVPKPWRNFVYCLLLAPNYFCFRLLCLLPKKTYAKKVGVRILGLKLKYKNGRCKCSL